MSWSRSPSTAGSDGSNVSTIGHALGEARFGDLAHAIEHFVDVDRRARNGARVAERLHAIDQGADAIGLVADQLRERLVVLRAGFFEQLRRAANAGERILDLMRQHRRHAVHRANGAAMQELAVDALRQAALLKQDHDGAFRLGERRRDDVCDAFAISRRRQIDVALADRCVALARLRHELKQRTAERHEVGESLAQEQSRAAVEELFGGRIDERRSAGSVRRPATAWEVRPR